MKKLIVVMLLVCMCIPTYSYAKNKQSKYAKRMVSLVSELSVYAKKQNPKFAMVANGGYNLYSPKSETKKKMLAAVDGVLIEDAFTNGDKKAMQKSLKYAIANHKKAFSIEYKKFKGKKSVVSFRAKKKLNKIPKYSNSKRYDVDNLTNVKNIMAILDPEKYKTKKAYLNAICNTDYDLVFIDLFYDENEQLTKADVDSLKVKKHGGKRLVCAYMSIGEAEDYRYYWKSIKGKKLIAKENKEWEGNYKVRYWKPAWKSILYGSRYAYLDRILNVGFDGVYLDVIDAYEYFE